MPEWTQQQLEAIRCPARRIICSAAAGSGKTAVMIERIVRMLQEGLDPETFLVVTFTNVAATEMKQKIRDRLRAGRADKNLRNALDKIDMMDICTIHSFCQHLIREEFQAAEVDPLFAVCEPARAKKLFSDAFRSACASLQKEQDPDYQHWKLCFDRKETEDIVTSVHAFMMSLPDPFDWLSRSCDDVPVKVDPEHPWFRTASLFVQDRIARADRILRRQFDMFSEPEHGEKYREVWKADVELFHVKQSWARGEDVPEGLLNAPFARLPSWSKLNRLEEDWKERYLDLRKQLKEIMEEITPLICPDAAVVERDFGNLRASLQGLKKITLRTAEAFAKKKATLRVLDFGDMEHFALKILSSEKVRPSVQKRYREIFVDECQDVSRVQDTIIQRLASEEGHLFMVGDVKQSIYRFRLADPTLFLDRQRGYGSGLDPEAKLLRLQTNFRSRPEILEAANTVFRDIMRPETAEIGYDKEEELLPGKTAEGLFPVQADILAVEGKEKLTAAADDMARRMEQLRQEGYRWRDMVILMPKVSGDGKKMADLLEERGIPVFFDGGGDYYERREVAVFRQLLSLIANPAADEPLLTTLRNAPFFFSEEELAQVRLRDPGKDVPFRDAFARAAKESSPLGDRCREASDRILAWRKLEAVSRMSDFVRFICSDSHQYAMAGASAAGRTAQQNLDLFCRKAEEAEKGGVWSLRRFLSYVEEEAGGGDASSAATLAEGDDVVRIMTMHKSKGLQFPVVFCAGLDNPVERAQGRFVMTDAELGICLRYKRPEFRVSRNTAAYTLFCWKKETEERAERIRLLYVAMTRAQERMFLVGAGEDRILWDAPAGLHRVLAAKDYLDWIVPALRDPQKYSTGYAQASKCWNISVLENLKPQTVENSPEKTQAEDWLETMLSAHPVDELWKDVQEGPYTSRMQKRSVTSLLRRAEKEIGEEEEETPESKRIPERFSRALEQTEIDRLPAFMGPPPEKRGAWRGTVVHRFLSLVDLARVRAAGENAGEALAAMKEEMLRNGVLTREEGEAVRPEEAAAFFRSPLGARLLGSPNVRREWGFNLYLQERNLLVQGVVDCAFEEDGAWVILDYKTDRVEDEEAFVSVYRPQLKWYAQAVSELTGKEVKESWLYSISRQQAYRV